MALFSDFFPSAGNNIAANSGVMITQGRFVVDFTAGNSEGTLTGDLLQNLSVGDSVSFNVGALNYIGFILENETAGNGTTIEVDLLRPALATLTGTQDAGFMRTGDTAINGDFIVIGDIYGDLTGNSDTSDSLSTSRTITYATGDVTGTFDFDGSADVVDIDLQIGAGAVGSAEIATDAVGRDEFAAAILATDSGLAYTDADGLSVNVDNRSILNTGGVLSVGTIDVNNTHVFTGTDNLDADAKADFISAFNTAGTEFGGITVPIGTELDRGDTVIIINGLGEAETYIFTAGDVVATDDVGTALITDPQLPDLTHSGDAVTTVMAGDGLTGGGSGDTVTLTVVGGTGLTANADDIQITDSGVTETQLNTSVAGNGISGGGGAALALDINGIADTETSIADDDIIAIFDTSEAAIRKMTRANFVAGLTGGGGMIMDLTPNFIPFANTATTLDDSLIQQNAGATQLTVGGTSSPIVSAGIGTSVRNVEVNAAGELLFTNTTDRRLPVTASVDGVTTTLVTVGSLILLTTITGSRNIQLPNAAIAGDHFQLSNLSGIGTGSGANRWAIEPEGGIGAGTVIVMGTTFGLGQNNDRFILDDFTASFEMIFAGGTAGWVIIGAN